MAKPSRKKRRQAKTAHQQASPSAVLDAIGKIVWNSAQAISTGITIYQAFPESTKALIKEVLSKVTMSLVSDLKSLPPDEQVVRAAKIISVQREIGKWFTENELPPMMNTFDERSLEEGVEQLLVYGVTVPEEALRRHFSIWRDYWALSSSLPVRNEEKKPKLKL